MDFELNLTPRPRTRKVTVGPRFLLTLFLIGVLLCPGLTSRAQTPVRSAPSSAPSPAQALAASLAAVAAAMSPDQAGAAGTLTGPVEDGFSVEAAGLSASPQARFLFDYDRLRLESFRSWAAGRRPGYSRIAVWSTFEPLLTRGHGDAAEVSGLETLHIDTTVRDDGRPHTFSPCKQRAQQALQEAGLLIGFGETNHATAVIRHDATLTRSASGWRVETDRFWDPLLPFLQADHETLMTPGQAGDLGALTPGSSLPLLSPQAASFSYSRSGAIAYADAWWNGDNQAYDPGGTYVNAGVDCADFVSQCMYDAAGGNLPGDNMWYPRSGAFVNATQLYNYARGNFSANSHDTTSDSDADYWQNNYVFPGDLAFYRWNYTGTASGYADHTAICVAQDANGNTYMDAHTTNLHHCPWDLYYASSTAEWYFVVMQDSSGGTTGTDGSAYVADVTVPDGTQFNANQPFTKTWRMQNTGTTTWGSGYQWVFVAGDQMGGPGAVAAPTVGPNGTADISLSLQAPGTPGSYKGYWQMQGPGGNFGDKVWVQIQVPNPPPTTPPSVTFGESNKNKWFGQSGLNAQIVSWTLGDQGGGLGGFSQSWDHDDDNNLGTAPQFPNSTSGNMQFGYLSPSLQEGQHTVYVRAWNRDHSRYADYASGWYGYDASPPTAAITSGQAPGAVYSTPQQVSFHFSEPLSGLAKWGAGWDRDPGAQPVTGDGGALALPVGTHILHLHAWDNAGNDHDWTFGPYTFAPITVSAVALSAPSVTGGVPVNLAVTLSGPAPAGGTAVTLTSSNSAASIPASVTVAAGATTATVLVSTSPVAADTPLTISAALGGAAVSAPLTVKAAVLASLSLTAGTITGGKSLGGAVTLSGPAPASGTVVALASSKTAAASTPATVTVSAGSSTASFAVTSAPVSANAAVTVSATAGGVTKTSSLLVTAASPAFTLTATATPASVTPSATTAIKVAVTDTGAALANGVVDIEIYNAGGLRVGQQSYTGQSFAANASRSYTYAWTAPTTPGAYTVEVGVFAPGSGTAWGPNLAWNGGAATVTVTAPDTAQYGFETGGQGWASSGGMITSVAPSTTRAFAGVQSLAVNLNAKGADTQQAFVTAPAAPAGSVVTFHVWIPAGSTITAVQPYVQQGAGGGYAWSGNWQPIGSLTANSWNAVTVTVPAGAQVPLYQLGVQFITGAAWSGTCYVDAVTW